MDWVTGHLRNIIVNLFSCDVSWNCWIFWRSPWSRTSSRPSSYTELQVIRIDVVRFVHSTALLLSLSDVSLCHCVCVAANISECRQSKHGATGAISLSSAGSGKSRNWWWGIVSPLSCLPVVKHFLMHFESLLVVSVCRTYAHITSK